MTETSLRPAKNQTYPFDLGRHEMEEYCRGDVDLMFRLEKLRGEMRDLLPIEGEFTLVREEPASD